MKQIIPVVLVFLAAAFFIATCQQKDKAKEGGPALASVNAPAITAEAKPVTTIQWLDSSKNIGKITEGEKVEITFRFKNTGDKQLVINNVMASCGCTVAEKPEKPIAPGETGIIKSAFNSTGRVGNNHKTITVYANTPEATHTVAFDVEVVAAAAKN
jgi:hypothetical protein